MPDTGPIPSEWGFALEELIVPELHDGSRMAVFCHAGHGRTGMFLASLIAIMEPPIITGDPVKAVRDRYCPLAVETTQQIEAIRALRSGQFSVQNAVDLR